MTGVQTCALPICQEPPVHLREGRLQGQHARAAGERERIPAELVELLNGPRGLERGRIACAQQPLQGADEATDAQDRIHAGKTTPRRANGEGCRRREANPLPVAGLSPAPMLQFSRAGLNLAPRVAPP